MLTSLAFQLSAAVPALRPAYEAIDPRSEYKNAEEAFERLLQEPLAAAAAAGQLPAQLLLLIDALDESEQPGSGGRYSPVVQLLRGKFGRLPALAGLWLIVTSRPEPPIVSGLQYSFKPFVIEADDPRHLQDVSTLLAAQLAPPQLADGVQLDEAVRIVVVKSQGVFLYVARLLEELDDRTGQLGMDEDVGWRYDHSH